MIFTQEQAILPIVNNASQTWGVSPALILAHMRQESSFNSNAERDEPSIGDYSVGLMQLLTRTAKSLDPSITPEQLYDPQTNVNLGTELIAENLARYGGSLPPAIAAYNAGSAFLNSNGIYTNSKGVPNVQGYVDKVLNNYDYYTKWLNNGAQAIDLTVWDVSTINPYLMGTFAILALVTIYRATKNKKMEVQYV